MVCAPATPTESAAVFRAVRYQRERVGLRYNREKFGKQPFARRVDPVCILDDVDGGFLTSRHRRIHQRGKPAPSGLGSDIGQRVDGITNSEFVLQEHQVGGVRSRHFTS